jgi:hypothetical protein
MKLIVRAFVLALVVTGAAATTMTASASASAQTNKAVATRVSLLPIPVCAPDDPNACGITLGHH